MGSSLDSVKLYMQELRTIPQVTEKEMAELFPKIKKGDGKAKKRMIEGNLRLVISIAKRYSCYGLDFLDLIEEGNVGLIKAIDKYDPDMGYNFSTYAFWWIRQYIQRAILSQTKTIHIPLYAYETIKKLINVSERMHEELERQPTTAELAKKLRLSIKKTRKFMQEIQVFERVGSLDSPLGDKFDIFLKDLIRDEEKESPDHVVDLIKSHEELAQILKKLSPQELKVIKLRYGMVDGKGYNLREVGEKMNLSRERIRQIEKRAIERLKKIVIRMQLHGLD
jgi:RNA polymerase primary sigma factor